MAMTLCVNGEQVQVPDALTIAGLVEHLKLHPQRVAVEHNRLLVPRARHAQTPLAAGDRLEIVTLVGGG